MTFRSLIYIYMYLGTIVTALWEYIAEVSSHIDCSNTTSQVNVARHIMFVQYDCKSVCPAAAAGEEGGSQLRNVLSCPRAHPIENGDVNLEYKTAVSFAKKWCVCVYKFAELPKGHPIENRGVNLESKTAVSFKKKWCVCVYECAELPKGPSDRKMCVRSMEMCV